MAEEKNYVVLFEGFKVDLFLCDNGDLGITVDKPTADGGFTDDNPSVDIFVNKETLEVHSI